MGKHEASYARVERDLYPTRETWVTEALLAHIEMGAGGGTRRHGGGVESGRRRRVLQ